jgi:hypothetical protein
VMTTVSGYITSLRQRLGLSPAPSGDITNG